MLHSSHTLWPWAPPSDDPRWNLALRIAESRLFEKSPKQRDFLLYVCQKRIQDEPGELREPRIGHNVFGRREDYNVGDDNIVRVEARLLRKRLQEYFETEGAHEQLILGVPKGGYVPRFEPRESPAEVVAESPSARPALAEPAAIPGLAEPAALLHTVPPKLVRRHRFAPAALLSITLLLLVCVVVESWLLLRPPVVTRPAARSPFWASLFNDARDTLVFVGDSSWVLRQDILGRNLFLSDYLNTNWNRSYSEEENPDPALRLLRTKQYTSIGDLRVVERLQSVNQQFWKRTAVRSARNAQTGDFKDLNLVLIGSIRSVPWEQLFGDQLNFDVAYDSALHLPIVRNRHPLPGEPSVYRNDSITAEPSVTYSAVSFVPNLNNNGNVLIVAGSRMEGCEASGEYLTDPKFLAGLLRRMGMNPDKTPPYFEVLLKSSTLAGSSHTSEIVSFRVRKQTQ